MTQEDTSSQRIAALEARVAMLDAIVHALALNVNLQNILYRSPSKA